MIERKIQLTGGSTFTVSLPKEWVSDIDLERGDSLLLYPQETQLAIEPAQTDELKEATVSVDDDSKEKVRRMVLAFYTSGFNKITLTDSSGFDGARRVIAETTRNLIGLEIIESAETQITLKNLLDSKTVSVEQSTGQMKQVALSMHEGAVSAFLEQETDRATQIADRDDQIDRLYAMVLRHFQRALENPIDTEEQELGRLELYDYHTTARQFERIADHAVKIANLATQLENPPAAEYAERIEEAGERSRNIVDQAATTIIDDDQIETAHEAIDRRDELIPELREIERELHDQEIPESHLIALTLDSLTRTAEYGANIAEASLITNARGQHFESPETASERR